MEVSPASRGVGPGAALLPCLCSVCAGLGAPPLPVLLLLLFRTVLPFLLPTEMLVCLFLLVREMIRVISLLIFSQCKLYPFLGMASKHEGPVPGKVSISYYLFPVFVFWTRPTVNTFMPPLLPKELFLLRFLHFSNACPPSFPAGAWKAGPALGAPSCPVGNGCVGLRGDVGSAAGAHSAQFKMEMTALRRKPHPALICL